jgi:hypothetical protein
MIVECKVCKKRYRLDQKLNRFVKCGRCDAKFFAFECIVPEVQSAGEAAQEVYDSPDSGGMGRGMKLFIGVSSAVVLLLILVIPLSLGGKWYSRQRQETGLREARESAKRATAATASGDFVSADEAITKAIRSAEAVPNPDAALLDTLHKQQAGIASKAQAQRQEEENRRLAEARRKAEAEALERQREAERRQEEEAAGQARKMYPAYNDSAGELANELLKMLSAIQAGLSYVQHSERLQQLQFVYNKFEMRCLPAEKKYTSYRLLSECVGKFHEAGAAWKNKIDSPSRSSSYETELQQAWSEARAKHREAMAALKRGE